jgi:hypothetical protein
VGITPAAAANRAATTNQVADQDVSGIDSPAIAGPARVLRGSLAVLPVYLPSIRVGLHACMAAPGRPDLRLPGAQSSGCDQIATRRIFRMRKPLNAQKCSKCRWICLAGLS